MDGLIKELTYEEALEMYNRWGRTILVGNSPTDYYEFNKLRDKKSLDDCIKQYLNYYDGPVRFFLNQRTIDRDMELQNKNESKNMNKKLIRLTEQDLHRIVKESVNKILNLNSQPSEYMTNKRKRMGESKEGYDYVMSVRNNPVFQKELKKAWNKEIKTNPNPDFDTFEYHFATIFLNKQMEDDADAFDRHLKDIGR